MLEQVRVLAGDPPGHQNKPRVLRNAGTATGDIALKSPAMIVCAKEANRIIVLKQKYHVWGIIGLF